MTPPAGLAAAIPSPTTSVWHLGPLPVRAYALCIVAGIVLAAWVGERRWRARGGRPGVTVDVAVWAVPFGVMGGRLYHVVTSPDAYFGEGGEPWRAFAVWEGGLGIWGAIALGGVGAWIGCRRAGVLLPPFGDAVAPGIVLAQAVGRWGNYANNELYGRATDLPWGLRVHAWDTGTGRAVRDAAGDPVVLGTFHPAFLYESLWDVGVAVLLVWADRRFRMGHGRVVALYALAYTAGRAWIEALRVDPAHHVLGLRLNEWTSLLVALGALTYLVVSARLRPGRETETERAVTQQQEPSGPPDGTDPAAATSQASEDLADPVLPSTRASGRPRGPERADAVEAVPSEAGLLPPEARH